MLWSSLRHLGGHTSNDGPRIHPQFLHAHTAIPAIRLVLILGLIERTLDSKKTGKVVYSLKAFCSTNIPGFQTTQESNEPNFLVEGGVPQAAKFKYPTKLLY